MSRPVKTGLDYFPSDVDYFGDMKIRRMLKACGPQSDAVFHYLLCLIYREGYFIQWTDDLYFLISDVTHVDEDLAEKIIKETLRVGLFDQAMLDRHKILTSRGIQKRYMQAMSQCRRKGSIAPKYNLLKVASEETGDISEETPITSEITIVNSEVTAVNAEFSTQRKLNKIKENYNESKLNKITIENIPPGFLDFADMYPKKKGLWAALEAWNEVNAVEHIEEIMIALQSYIVSEDWQKQDGQFVQQPANWLKRRLWEKEIKPARYTKLPPSDPFLDVLKEVN